MKYIKGLTVLGLIMAGSVTAYAAQPTVSVNIPDQKEVTDGKYVVSVDIADNPGFASLQMELYYNKDVLSCEKVVPGDVVKGMLTDSNPMASGEKTSAILSVAGFNNTAANSNLATFVFDEPKSGDPKIEFVLTEMVMADGTRIVCETKINDNYGDVKVEDSSSQTENKKPVSSGGSSKVEPTEKTEQPVIENETEKTPVTFSDVTNKHWAKSFIEKAVAMGLVKGMPDGTFAPDKAMTRAEFATILWNMAGRPEAGVVTRFADVKVGEWYTKQIAWASQSGYITGISETEFSPNGLITREQAMAILYRYAGRPAVTETLNSFKDKSAIYDYALPAMGWAVENNIISGVADGEIAPKMSATRAQLATIMVRFLNS